MLWCQGRDFAVPLAALLRTMGTCSESLATVNTHPRGRGRGYPLAIPKGQSPPPEVWEHASPVPLLAPAEGTAAHGAHLPSSRGGCGLQPDRRQTTQSPSLPAQRERAWPRPAGRAGADSPLREAGRAQPPEGTLMGALGRGQQKIFVKRSPRARHASHT